MAEEEGRVARVALRLIVGRKPENLRAVAIVGAYSAMLWSAIAMIIAT